MELLGAGGSIRLEKKDLVGLDRPETVPEFGPQTMHAKSNLCDFGNFILSCSAPRHVSGMGMVISAGDLRT